MPCHACMCAVPAPKHPPPCAAKRTVKNGGIAAWHAVGRQRRAGRRAAACGAAEQLHRSDHAVAVLLVWTHAACRRGPKVHVAQAAAGPRPAGPSPLISAVIVHQGDARPPPHPPLARLCVAAAAAAAARAGTRPVARMERVVRRGHGSSPLFCAKAPCRRGAQPAAPLVPAAVLLQLVRKAQLGLARVHTRAQAWMRAGLVHACSPWPQPIGFVTEGAQPRRLPEPCARTPERPSPGPPRTAAYRGWRCRATAVACVAGPRVSWPRARLSSFLLLLSVLPWLARAAWLAAAAVVPAPAAIDLKPLHCAARPQVPMVAVLPPAAATWRALCCCRRCRSACGGFGVAHLPGCGRGRWAQLGNPFSALFRRQGDLGCTRASLARRRHQPRAVVARASGYDRALHATHRRPRLQPLDRHFVRDARHSVP